MGDTYKDRVRETTNTVGTGTLALAGAVVGHQEFESIGNAATCRYTLVDNNGIAWETGIGTYTLATNTLSRDSINDSSNGGSRISLGTGPHQVFLTPDATAIPFKDAANTFTNEQSLDMTPSTNQDAYGWQIYIHGKDAANSTSTGIYVEAETSDSTTNNSGTAYGVNGSAGSNLGTGRTVADVVAVVGQAANFAAGTITNAYAFMGRARNDSTGTVGSAIGVGVLSSTNTGGGSITTVYGLKIENQTAGATNYAILTGTGHNYLGDRLTWKPPASITPAANGDLTFEATNNTTITVKFKGSDGTVRSGTITLT